MVAKLRRLESANEKRSEEVDCSTYGPFTEDDVGKAINNISRRTVPGVDGWKLGHVLKFTYRKLRMIFNKWYLVGVPKAVKICRTILIFKAGERTDVGNWRPITINTMLLRLCAKVWDQRIRKNVEINERHKAFQHVGLTEYHQTNKKEEERV